MVRISNDYYQHLATFLFEKKAQGKSAATLKSYEFSVSKFLDFIKNQPVNKYAYYAYINSLDLSGDSKKHYARELRVFLYWCMDEGIIDKFKISLPKAQEATPKIPTKDEVDRLLEKPKNNFTSERIWVIVNLTISTGIRARTIVNLKVDDISFEQQQLILRETKSKKLGIIPLSKELCAILKRYINKYNLTDWLFPNMYGGQLTTEGLGTAYERYAISKSCSQHGIHSLRHYFATEATRAGVSPFVLQKVLQHSDISVTMKYVNLVNSDVKKELLVFNPLNR